MNILEVTPSYPRYPGDYHGRFIQDLCHNLSKHVKLQVLAPRSRSCRPMKHLHPVHRYPYLPYKGLEWVAERTMKGAPAVNLSQLPAYLTAAYINILKTQADIIHAHLAIPMGLLAGTQTRPLVITCHGSDCTLPYYNPAYRPLVRQAFKKADRIVTVSHTIRKVAQKLGADKNKITVSYLGVNTDHYTPPTDQKKLRNQANIPEEATVIGSLGRLVKEKQVSTIIEAFALAERKQDLYLLIGGDGPERSRLEQLAKKQNIQNIRFTGTIKNAARFHQICNIYILASIREGLSITLQEAMACSCTPIAVNTVGCPEIIKNNVNGLLYKPGDKQTLSQNILQATKQPELGVNARKTILKRFDMAKNALSYVNIFRELSSKR